MKLLETILEKNNPKLEINHIFMDGENLVATDTKILIVKRHNEKMEEGFNALLINPKAKYPIKSEAIILDKTANKSMASGYPNYKRIIPQTGKNYGFEKCDGLTLIQLMMAKYNLCLDLLGNSSFYKQLAKMNLEWYTFDGYNMPISIGNKEYTIVIMPMIFPQQKEF